MNFIQKTKEVLKSAVPQVDLLQQLKPMLLKKAERGARKKLNAEPRKIVIKYNLKLDKAESRFEALNGKTITTVSDDNKGSAEIFLNLVKKKIGEKIIKEIIKLEIDINFEKGIILCMVFFIDQTDKKIKSPITI